MIGKNEKTKMLKSNCKICGGRINIGRDKVVREGEDLVHLRCVGEKCIMHVIYCGNYIIAIDIN